MSAALWRRPWQSDPARRGPLVVGAPHAGWRVPKSVPCIGSRPRPEGSDPYNYPRNLRRAHVDWLAHGGLRCAAGRRREEQARAEDGTGAELLLRVHDDAHLGAPAWVARRLWLERAVLRRLCSHRERLRVHPQGEVLCSARYVRNEVGLALLWRYSSPRRTPSSRKRSQGTGRSSIHPVTA